MSTQRKNTSLCLPTKYTHHPQMYHWLLKDNQQQVCSKVQVLVKPFLFQEYGRFGRGEARHDERPACCWAETRSTSHTQDTTSPTYSWSADKTHGQIHKRGKPRAEKCVACQQSSLTLSHTLLVYLKFLSCVYSKALPWLVTHFHCAIFRTHLPSAQAGPKPAAGFSFVLTNKECLRGDESALC